MDCWDIQKCLEVSVSDHMDRMVVMALVPKEEHLNKDQKLRSKQVTQLLTEDLRKELYKLWGKYETQSCAEAKFVNQVNQCEMILQACDYEDLENKPGRLQDFYNSTAGKFSHPEIVQLVSELEGERKH